MTLTAGDNGPGIPIEHQARIFDRFHRGTANRSTDDTGLGVAIVRSLVEAHGGTSGLISESSGPRFVMLPTAAER